MTVVVDSQVSDRCPWATCFVITIHLLLQNLSIKEAIKHTSLSI